MTNCLARLMLAPAVWVATSVGPQAGECPVFPARENFTCKQFGTATETPQAGEPVRTPLRLQKTPEGYLVGLNGKQVLLKEGNTHGYVDDQGQNVETTISCERVTLLNGKQFETYMLKKSRNGEPIGGTVFYTERGGLVAQGYDRTATGPKFTAGMSCSQVVGGLPRQ